MATRDFRSQQIRTTQIIASGSDTTSKPSLLIYSASAATNDQGSINANLLSGAGEDAWLFISGSTNTADGQQVLFGGNIAVSGSLSGSSLASLPDGSITIEADEDIVFKSSGTEYFQVKNDTQDEVVINDGGNDIDFRVETNQLKSAIHVNANQDLVVIGRRADPSDLTSASSPAVGDDVVVFIDGAANTKDSEVRGSTLVAGDLVVSGTLYAERQVMEVDLNQTGNLVMSGAVHFEDLGAAGGSDGKTTIAVPIDNGALFVATGSLRFRTTTNGTDFIETNVGAQYVAGNGLESTTVGSTTTFETDDTIVAHLTGSQFSGNVGITGSFGVTGNVSLEQNQTIYFNGLDGDVFISGDNSSLDIDGDNTVTIIADTNAITEVGTNKVQVGLVETTFNVDGENHNFVINTSQSTAAFFIDSGDDSIIIGAETLIGSSPNALDLFNKGYGSDVKIMLSGSAGSKDGSTRGVVSVPGDIVVSGTLYYADNSSSESYLSSPGNGLSRDINSNNRTIELSLNDISGSAAITSSDSFAFIDADDSATKKATVGQLSTAIAGDGLTQSSNQLNVNVDDSTIQIDSNTLKVKNYGIRSLQLNASIAGDGLNGAGGLALSVDAGNGLKIGSSSDVITDDAVVAHLSGSEFNGHVGITGSLAVDGDMSLSANSILRFNDPVQGDQTITGNEYTLTMDGDNFIKLVGDISVSTNVGSSGTAINDFRTNVNEFNTGRLDIDFEVNTDNYYGTILVDAADDSIILGHEGFDTTPSASETDGYGDDVKIMLSGSAGSKDGSTRGVVLVPGDMVISGTLYDGDGSRINLFSYDENGTFATPSSATGTNSVAIGNKAVASGNNSIALGTSETNTTEATGLHAAALGGDDATASGDYSTVLGGYGNTASGDYSVALGRSSEAKGENSIAIGVSLVAGEDNSIAIGNNTNDSKVVISGTLETKALADFATDAAVSGSFFVSEYIRHIGNEDTAVHFLNNKIRLQVGTKKAVKVNTDSVLILSGGHSTSVDQTTGTDVAFFVSGSANSKDSAVRGLSLFGGDVHISGSLSGPDEYTLTDSTVRIFRDGSTMKFDDGENVVKTLSELASLPASTDFFVGVHGADSSTAKLKATGSVAFSGDSDNFVDGLQSEGVGQDVFVFFSGSIGSKDGTTRGVTLFGGDTVFSGSTGFTNVAAANNVIATGSLIAGGDVIKNSNGDKNIVFDSSNPYNLFADASIIDSISAQSNVHIEKDSNTQASVSNVLSDFGLVLRNDSTQTDAFAGIAFDVSTETDADSIGAAIRAQRDTTAGSTPGLHDTNLTFSTNDGGDGTLYERMRITHDGNVGIGLTNPLDSLHTSGDIRVGGNVIRASDGGSTITMDTSDNVTVGGNITAGSGNFYAASGQTLTINSPHHVIVKLDTDNNGAAEFQIDNGAGTEIFVVDESGNLQIDGDLTVSGNDIKDSGGNTVFTFDGSGNVSNAVDFSSGVTVAGNLDIADRLRHIGDTNTQIRFVANNKISMETSSGGLFLVDAASAQKEVVINEVGADVDFRVESDNSSYALFVQGSSRNVGIGNNSPSYPLDVTGDIRLSGDLRVDGNNIIGSALELDSTSTITLDATGDIILSADGDQIRMNDGTTERFTFNVDSTPELDVTGNFIIDGSGTIEIDSASTILLDAAGDITLDADGGQIYFNDNGTTYLTFNVDGSTDSIAATGNLTLDASGDITLDAAGDDIFFKDNGSTRFQFNLDTSPSIDVTGAFEIDCSSNITLDADGGTITFADNGVSLGTITSTGYSGNAASATSVAVTNDTSTNATHYLTFVGSTSGNRAINVDSSTLTYNPSSNTLTVANLAGNASSADTIDTTATSTNSSHYVTFVDSSSSTSGETLRVDSGLVYNPSSNNLTVSGDLTVSGFFQREGEVGIRNTRNADNSEYLVHFEDMAANRAVTRQGLRMDVEWHTSYDTGYIIFVSDRSMNGGAAQSLYRVQADGDGTSTVTTTFTGFHDTALAQDELNSPGLIVESTGEMWVKNTDHDCEVSDAFSYSTVLPYTRLATTNGSKTVFGVLATDTIKWEYDPNDSGIPTGEINANWKGIKPACFTIKNAGNTDNHTAVQVMSVGEGAVWVTNINGNIENGDLIESSEIPGHGRLQDDDIMRSKTVAKCTETIDWDSVTETIEHNGQTYKKYLTGCTFHCG